MKDQLSASVTAYPVKAGHGVDGRVGEERRQEGGRDRQRKEWRRIRCLDWWGSEIIGRGRVLVRRGMDGRDRRETRKYKRNNTKPQ